MNRLTKRTPHAKGQRTSSLSSRARATRSPSSSISRIPDEILSAIFLCGREDGLERWKELSNHCPALDSEIPAYWDALNQAVSWLNVQGVCRHWRQVCLNTPAMWSKISFTEFGNMNVGIVKLKRVKAAPMSVKFSMLEEEFNGADSDGYGYGYDYEGSSSSWAEDEDFWRIAKRVFSTSAQLEELVVVARNFSSIARLFSVAKDTKVPLLRSLVLECFDEGIAHIPKNLFWDTIPALRSLELREVPLPINLLPRAPKLTRLVVSVVPSPHGDDDDGPGGISPNTAYRLIKNTPMLEELSLGELHLDEPASLVYQLPQEPKVDLPHLQTIKLRSSSIRWAELFNHLRFPTTTNVEFHCETSSMSSPGRDAALNCINNISARKAAYGRDTPKGGIIHGYEAFFNNERGMTLEYHPLTTPGSPRTYPTLGLCVHLRDWSGLFPSDPRTLADNVYKLSFTFLRFHRTRALFTQILPTFKNVREVELDKADLLLLDILTEHTSPDPSSGASMILPELKEVVLTNYSWEPDLAFQAGAHEYICRILDARKSLRLTIMNSCLRDEMKKALQPYRARISLKDVTFAEPRRR